MTVIQQWAPQTGYVSRQLPWTPDDWSPTDSAVARYLLHLKVLGLADPTKATEHYRTALALRDHSIAVSSKNGEADLANRLATGELNPAEAAKLLAKVPTAREEQEKEERGRRMLADAVRVAYTNAVRAMHNYGDKWLDLLRPLVQEAVAAQDQARWDSLHAFAALLRHRDLAALAIVSSDPNGMREIEETWRYRVGKPHRYHDWRLERAVRTHAAANVNVGSNVFVGIAVTEGPHPTLQEMGGMEPIGGMEPGIYSAEQVIDITEAVLEQQEADQVSAEPPPPSRRTRAEVTS